MAKKPAEAGDAPKKKSKFKLIMILVALLLVIASAAGGFWWFSSRDGSSIMSAIPGMGASAGGTEEVKTTAPGAPQVVQTLTVPLPTVTVNLSDPSGTRYLKVGMEVEVSSADAVPEIQGQTAKIRDAIIILLSSKTYAELSTAEGKIQVKNEVASRLNQILGTPRVVRIYFTEFVVQ